MATTQGRRLAPSELLEQANAHYRAQRPEEAVRLFREYLAIAPDRADVRVYLGAALLNRNDPAAALEQVRRAIEIDPRTSKAYLLAGRIYAARQQWEIAQEFFRKALDLDASDRDAWYFSGRALYEASHFEESIRALLKAGDGARVYENLGLAYEAAGRTSEAERVYKRAVQASEGAYRPYLAYGVFLFKQGRLSESLPMLREAARLQPRAVDARFELGRALYQAGQYADALSALPDEVPPDQCRVHNLRARILSRLGHSEQAAGAMNAIRSCMAAGSELQR